MKTLSTTLVKPDPNRNRTPLPGMISGARRHSVSCCVSLLACSALATAATAQEQVIFNFKPNNTGQGWDMSGNVLVEANGNLIGTGGSGGEGEAGAGVVYEATPPSKKNPSWNYQVIYRFPSEAGEDTSPLNGLTLGKNGVLYGLSNTGGTNGCGFAYRLTPPASTGGQWKETNVYDFAGGIDGCGPLNQQLLFDATTGSFYGTTEVGGTLNEGTLFRLDPPGQGGGSWTKNILYNFTGGNVGAFPSGSLTGDPRGILYGTTQDGGSGSGLVWGYDTVTGVMNYVWLFGGGQDGATPVGGVIGPFSVVVDGVTLYYLVGTAAFGGGTSCNCGTVFQIEFQLPLNESAGEHTLHAFQGTDGAYPMNGLALAGTTAWGTAGAGGIGWSATTHGGNGALFEIQEVNNPLNINYVAEYSFLGGTADGAGPETGVAVDSAGNVYGMTTFAGTHGYGTLYKFVP